MGNKDKRIDAYISKSEEFAQPILNHLRKLVHAACPNVQETIRWSMPFFDYRGMLCNMAAFKRHCAFGFYKSKLMVAAKEMTDKNENAMGHLGKITSLKDLPPDKKITSWIKEAMKLNDEGIKLPDQKKSDVKKETEMPALLKKALDKNKKALNTFSGMSHSHQTEYIEWINEAKTDETRNKRITTTIEWVTEGKSRNWKYMRK